jgi:hypothetical protein
MVCVDAVVCDGEVDPRELVSLFQEGLEATNSEENDAGFLDLCKEMQTGALASKAAGFVVELIGSGWASDEFDLDFVQSFSRVLQTVSFNGLARTRSKKFEGTVHTVNICPGSIFNKTRKKFILDLSDRSHSE